MSIYLTSQVVIGQNFVVPPYSKVSLLKQPTKQDSDEELEYADNDSDTLDPGVLLTYIFLSLTFGVSSNHRASGLASLMLVLI